MNEAIIRLGGFSIYGLGILAVFAFLWGSFVFYRKAVEAHFEDLFIFDAVVLAAFWGFIGGRLAYIILNVGTFWNHWSRIFFLTSYPGVDEWGVITGLIFGLWLIVRKIKGKFWDWFDLVALGVSAGTAIFYVGLAILSFSWQYLVFGALYLALFVYLWWMVDKYRTFGWYRAKKTSARSGLIGGLSISLWGILSLVERVLFMALSWPWILWGLVLLVGGIVLVYIRSGRTWNEDIKIIFKNGRK